MTPSEKELDFSVHTWKRQGLGGIAPDDSQPPPSPDATELRCTISGTSPRFMSTDGAFAIWNAVWEPTPGEARACSIKGDLGRVSPGEMLSCKGKWSKHDKHGWSFQVSEYHSALPVTAAGVATWLETKVDGVGPVFAKAIVKHFGENNVFDVLDADPSKLREVKTERGRSLPEKQVEKAISAWEDVKAIRQIEAFLFSHNVSANLAGKLYRKYGPSVVDILRENPYRVTEMRGIGFKIADKIAISMGTPLDHPHRMMAAILYVLDEAEGQGHTFLSLQQLTGHTMAALTPPGENSPPEAVRDPQKIVAAASKLSGFKRIVVEDDEYMQQRVYSKRMHDMECRLAARVRHLLDTPPKALFAKPARPAAPAGASEEAIEKMGLPSDAQWSAVEMVRLHRLSILSGGPGVGKCVGADTPVFVNGTIMRAEDIWNSYAVDPVWAEDGYWAQSKEPLLTNSIKEGHIVSSFFTRLWKQRVCESGRRVRLDDGSELTLTNQHQLLGVNGWNAEFQIGDRVCLPRQLYWRGHPLSPNLVTPLARQIGRRLDTQERIPDFIMAADDASIALFMRELFAAASHVNPKARQVEISSTSRWLILQLATLLRRFGIWMTIRHKTEQVGSDAERAHWKGIIPGPSLRLFCEHIGIADPMKMACLQSLCAVTSNRDIIPFREFMIGLSTGLSHSSFGVSSCYMKGERDVSREKGRNMLMHVEAVNDGSAETTYRALRPTGKSGHRYRAQTLESFSSMDYEVLSLLEQQMQERIERDVFYTTIVSVEDIWLDEDVYDFEVTGTHNYVASGVLCHNTHTQKTLVNMLVAAGKEVKLAAPTGKAARRMHELTAHPASTIHRLLEFSPFEGGFQRSESNPIEADCVIIDETSMLSLELADSLFSAIGEHTHVLLVGDPDQLAPVGAGKVLDDLIRTERVPRVHLAKIFRQAAQSMIIQNSRRINRGLLPYLRKEEAESALQHNMLDDFFWITRSSPEETAELVLDLVCNRLPRSFDLNPIKDIMVLAPMRNGKVGLHYLNSELERRLNSNADGTAKKPIISRKYKLGDRDVFENICVGSRIVQTQNDYSESRFVMNGEVGIVLAYDEVEKVCTLSLDDGEREIQVPVPDMDSYYLAWALTTHKSQGSEFTAVVVPVSTAHWQMLNRALYYTAVTRAQKLCVMVGEKKALSVAVSNLDLKKRNSTLAARILDPALSGELF